MIVAIFALALAANAQVGDTLTDADLVTLRQKVADELRDPPSAYFRDVEIRSKGTYEYVCGWVSGRNGFGGMAQPTRFLTIGPVASLIQEGPRTVALWERECGRNSANKMVRRIDWNAR